MREKAINPVWGITGFLEKVHENALAHERRKAELAVEQQRTLTITYDGIVVGE